MDDFTAFLFETYESEKNSLPTKIKAYLAEHGEDLINLRDSTGNCLIHTLCMSLQESD